MENSSARLCGRKNQTLVETWSGLLAVRQRAAISHAENSTRSETDMRPKNEYEAEKTKTGERSVLSEPPENSQQEDQEDKDEKSQTMKCECPPGCVGLPCCA